MTIFVQSSIHYFHLQGRAGSREYQVGKCILLPKLEAAGEGSGFTVCCPPNSNVLRKMGI
jgi:hypothetical protein